MPSESDPFSVAEAEALGSAWLGKPVTARALYGEFDQNLLLATGDGERFVLKITADASEHYRSLVGLQLSILGHLASRSLEIECPRPVPDRAGAHHTIIADRRGQEHIAWVLTYIEGGLLDDQESYHDELLRSLGRAVAVVDHALLDFSDSRAERAMMWDVADALSVRPLRKFVTERRQLEILEFFLDEIEKNALPRLDTRPRSVIHNDGGNQHNMIVRDVELPGGGRSPQIVGIIDFGDAVKTQRVCGLGITAAYAAFGRDDPIEAFSRVASGYDSVLPLEDEDVTLLPWLAGARLVMSVSIAAKRAFDEPDDEYGFVSAAPAWRVLERLREADFVRASREIRDFVNHGG